MLLSISTLAIIYLLKELLYNPPEAFSSNLLNGDPLFIKAIILFASILSFAAYIIRLFSKLSLSSFHLHQDAKEREQLTMVYLALVKEGKVSENEREIILQSLFSRAESGLLSGDSSPTMPYVDILKEQFKHGKK